MHGGGVGASARAPRPPGGARKGLSEKQTVDSRRQRYRRSRRGSELRHRAAAARESIPERPAEGASKEHAGAAGSRGMMGTIKKTTMATTGTVFRIKEDRTTVKTLQLVASAI